MKDSCSLLRFPIMKAPSILGSGLILCLLLSACTTMSENPLSSPGSARPDPALVGSWQEKGDKDEILEFTIKDAHWMHLEDRKKDRPPESYDLFVTEIDGFRFLNVQYYDTDDKGHPVKQGYYLVRYEISGKRLATWWLDQDKAANAIRTGRLKGIIHQDKNPMMVGKPPHPDVDVTLQDSGANLIKFIRQAGAKAIFSDRHSDLYRVDRK
jgi:hypothetical protein